MSIKLGRQFQMTIYPTQYRQSGTQSFGQPITFTQAQGQPIRIQNPFTLMFNVTRTNMAPANAGSFQIYNLNPTTRGQLYYDYYARWGLKRITLNAGYASQGSLPCIFDGGIQSCSSYRKQGMVNYITDIEADNWSFPTYNAYTSKNFSGQVPKQNVVDQLVKDVCAMGPPGGQVRRGYIHQYTGITQWYPVISGNSWERLRTETDGACFIDNGMVNILGNDEYIPGSSFTIEADTGLLGSPKRYQDKVVIEMLFEPSLIIGQVVTLNSVAEPTFNGQYQVYSINHAGIISDAIGGKCQTTLSLFNLQKNANLISLSESTV